MNNGALRQVFLVMRREWQLLSRTRATRVAVALLFVIAWLPPLLVSLRSGQLGVASFPDVVPLALAIGGVVLPLLGLLAGADLLASEIEDGWLVSIVTLPVSRTACFAGKITGRATAFSVSYVAAMASALGGIWLVRGAEGWQDYAVVAGAGLLLSLSCGGIGTALAAAGNGRLSAYASSLGAWLILVLAVDALLLAAIVVVAPAAPTAIGQHGHDELGAEMETMNAGHDPSGGDAQGAAHVPAWFLVAGPGDLFRVTAVSASPGLAARWSASGLAQPLAWAAIALGWLFWLGAPPLVGLLLFRRVPLG